jgi:hypothetical protein
MSVHRLLVAAAGLALGYQIVSCGSSETSGGARSGAGGSSTVDSGARGGAPQAGGANAGSGGPSASDARADSPIVDSGSTTETGDDHATSSGLDASAFPNVMFDDFEYADRSDAALTQFGWTLKSGSGAPGPINAIWSPNGVSFVDDAAGADAAGDGASSHARLLRLTSSTQGLTTISQAEICHQFVFFEGTYAARVRFADTSFSGASTDQVVQAFFTISAPNTRDMGNAAYSECDLEYTPNGAWGYPVGLWAVTWESYDYTDAQDIRNNLSILTNGSRQGWHILNIVVLGGNVVYTIDGANVATHGGVYYPESPMAICFNLWFSPGIADAGTQAWVEDIDWVLHVKGENLTAAASEQKVADLRTGRFTRLNTIH